MANKIIKPAYTVYFERRRIDFLHSGQPASLCNTSNGIKTIDWAIFMVFLKSNKDRLCCISNDPTCAFRGFATLFQPLEAAGGLVVNAAKEWLFIFRNGTWDLPKGVIEPGETAESAATREVEEECGISGLQIIGQLPHTYHIYQMKNNKWILKKTHWFLMKAGIDIMLKPQAAEGITLAAWRNPGQIKDIRESTYGSINELLDHCISEWYANQSHLE